MVLGLSISVPVCPQNLTLPLTLDLYKIKDKYFGMLLSLVERFQITSTVTMTQV